MGDRILTQNDLRSICVRVWPDGEGVLLIQGRDSIVVALDTLPALISALQAAMQDTPTTDRGEE